MEIDISNEIPIGTYLNRMDPGIPLSWQKKKKGLWKKNEGTEGPHNLYRVIPTTQYLGNIAGKNFFFWGEGVGGS